jgi:hypothetical protein
MRGEMMTTNEMTYEEFLAKVLANHEKLGNEWRYGQTFFNTMSAHRPDIAEMLRGSLHDPFHKEVISQDTHNFISVRW